MAFGSSGIRSKGLGMSRITLLDLSRWRWALTAAMHITFPAVTVGTSVFEYRDTCCGPWSEAWERTCHR